LAWTDVYMSEQRQGGSAIGQQTSGHAPAREGTAKVRSSSASGITHANGSQPRKCRSGCVSSDQIDSGAASSRDGSEIHEGELKSREIIEELEKLHVNGSSVLNSSNSERVNVLKACCSHESPASNHHIPSMHQGIISNTDSPVGEVSLNPINRTSISVCSDISSRMNVGGINERSTDTLVPDCDIEERSSKLKQPFCDPSKSSSNGTSSELSGEKPSTSPSKDILPAESAEEKNGHTKQNACTDICNYSPNNILKKYPCQHQNSSYLSATAANVNHQQIGFGGCNTAMNATCCSSDDTFSTEDEDVLGNNGGLDTAYSSRHYTSSQNSTSQNMIVEHERCSFYDSDGLLSHNNGVQRRLVSIFASHKKQVNHLKRDLYLTRMALCRSKLAHHNHHRGPTNQANNSNICNGTIEGNCNLVNGGRPASFGLATLGNGVAGDNHIGGCASSVQSDASSWEAVDEKETKPTLWVPDHAVSCCMRCRTQFWFGRRKHHCRNCGQLYCSECSDNLAPIPSEQLYHPVRICDDCFQKLYPEEAAKKALDAEISAAKSEAIEMNFCQTTTNVCDSTQEPNENTSHTTLEQPILQKTSNDEASANDIDVNDGPQNESSVLLISSDIKDVVTSTKDKPNSVLEGEACVILNTS